MSTLISPIYQQTSSFPRNQVLTREEAKSRLYKLTPGTEEYIKLQNALIKATGIVEISLPTTTYKVNSCLKDNKLLGGFGSSEHVEIGKAVKLQGLSENPPLFVKGVTPVRFEHIVALAGDFYGVPGKAVSLPGGTNLEKTERFKNAFNKLYQADNDELRRILLEIDEECAAVKNSSLPHHCYSSHLMEKSKAIKKIKNDVDDLLIDNSDHFSKDAIDTYFIGHDYALSVAREAGQQKDLEKLKLAYAIDAYTCHFLTDLFAAGHIRNQRGALESFLISQLGFSETVAKPLAGILTGAQHEKDGHDGLNVYNANGDHWRAYGDGSFFGPNNKENRDKVIQATQESVNEIYNAYLNPEAYLNFNSSQQSSVRKFIPKVEDYNPLPLYSVKETSLVLHQVSEDISIQGGNDFLSQKVAQANFLKHGISQALNHLPESYINSVINPLNIEMPSIVEKIIIPQVERFTGIIWHMIGIATYHQVKQENLKLNEKVDELATTVNATYENSVKILEQMKTVQVQLHQLSWNSIFKEISESIKVIRDKMFVYKNHKTFTKLQLEEYEKELSNANVRLSRVFCDGLVDNKKMLEVYKATLEKGNPPIDPSEIIVAVTLWFRQMLDYQAQAFGLYAIFQAKRYQYDDLSELQKQKNLLELQKQISEFESIMIKQLTTNKGFIDDKLIKESVSYIYFQLEKTRIKNKSLNFFKSLN